MPILKEIKIVKVPLSENEKTADFQPNFPTMPILYLELFENKQKIKQNLVNKDYVPPAGTGQTGMNKTSEFPDGRGGDGRGPDGKGKKEDNTKDTPKDNTKDKNRHQDVEIDEHVDKHINEDINEDIDERIKHDSPETPTISRSASASEKSSPLSRSSPSVSDEENRKDSEYSDRSDSRSYSSSDSDSNSPSHASGSSRSSRSSHAGSSDSEEDQKHSEDDDEVTDRLKKLLADTSQTQEKYSHSSHGSRDAPEVNDKEKSSPFDSDKYSQPVRSIQNKASKFSPYTRVKEETREANPAPTLSELQAKGLYQGKREMININHIPGSEYEEEDKKRELLFKFSLLKKSYPLAQNIPEYTLLTDYREMQKGYDLCVKSLSLDSSVESYKKYLIFGSMGMELILGKILGFDMQGFTQQQILNMNQYEKLLIELGEKSYVPQAKNYPVEVRLLFLLTMNSGIFIVSKMLAKKTGVNLLSGINTMMSPPAAPATEKRKGRMKGPTINLEDLENLPK